MTQKIRIRIKRPLGEIVVTRKVRSDGKSAILWKENERKHRPEWIVKFGKNGCVYRTKKTLLGGKQDTIDVYPWSEEAVVHDYENEKDLGSIEGASPKLATEFTHHLMLEVSRQ